MSQELQIVPKYLHSHVETYINDYTTFDDQAATENDENVKFIAVFSSGEGIDNKLVKRKSASTFTKTFGKLNFSKYGQPMMMPLAELENGYATVNCMRVMPDDAAYANAILSMMYKKDTVTGKFIIKHVSQFFDNINTDAELAIAMSSLATTEPDADGFIKIPYCRIRMVGRGEYGNQYRFRIVNNFEYEKDYGIKMFSFEVLSTKTALSSVENYIGSIVTSPSYDVSTLINDVIDDKDIGDAYFDIRCDETSIDKVYSAFVEFVKSLPEELQDDIPDEDKFDPFFGTKVASILANENIKIETSSDDVIAVDKLDGIPLCGGSDGSLSETTDAIIKSNTLEKLYCDAFEGELDEQILSNRRVPCDVYLDANYPFAAKQSFYELIMVRNDAVGYLDSGIVASKAQIPTIINDYKQFNSRNVSKQFQYYKVRDPLTKRKIDVTITYFFAQTIAYHFKIYGKHIPFVKERCTLEGHVKNSLMPAVELIDLDIKEELNNHRINYFETTAENVFIRSCQNTAQIANSDLLEENNMHILFAMKRIIEDDCTRKLYDFANASERQQFKEYEEAKFANWIGREVASFSIDFQMNKWEAERSILHCYIAVQFRTLNKRTIIEIDVNKRDFES